MNHVIKTLVTASMLVSTTLVSVVALATPTVVEVAISPDAYARQGEILNVVNANLDGLKKDDVLVLTNAATLQRIGKVTMTEDVGDNKAARIRILKQQPDLGKIFQFLKSAPTTQAPANLVRYLNGLDVRTREFPQSQIKVAYFGSPIVLEPAAFSMSKGYPTDGAFFDQLSPYSVIGKANKLANVQFHVVYSPSMSEFTPVDRDLHKEKLKRFYSLYLQQLGSKLVSFSSQSDHLRTLQTQAYPAITYTDLNKNAKLGMYEIKPPQVIQAEAAIQTSLWSQASILNNPAPPTKQELLNPIDLGIKWDQNVDVDLYAKGLNDTELYFGNKVSPNGKYLEDIRVRPQNNGYETIVYANDIPVDTMRVFINHYSGESKEPIAVEFRIRLGNKVYFKKLQLPAGTGNFGKGNRQSDRSWVNISLLEVLGLRA